MEYKGYNVPEDLMYDKNHFWIKKEGHLLVMGMDDFAQQLAGDRRQDGTGAVPAARPEFRRERAAA